jgi:hypothetical protein
LLCSFFLDRESVMAIVHAHAHEPPDLSGLPEAERPGVTRALAKCPEERWPSCRAFVRALAAASRTSAGRSGPMIVGGAPRAPWLASLARSGFIRSESSRRRVTADRRSPKPAIPAPAARPAEDAGFARESWRAERTKCARCRYRNSF